MRYVSVVLFSLFTVACSNAPGDPRAAPSWAGEASHAENDGERRRITGIGAASDVANDDLAQHLAENRARAEVSRIFESFSGALVKAYVEHAGDDATAQSRVSEILHRLSGSALPLAVVTASETGHARAELDVAAWLSALPEEPELLAEERAFFMAEGAELFESFVSKGEW